MLMLIASLTLTAFADEPTAPAIGEAQIDCPSPIGDYTVRYGGTHNAHETYTVATDLTWENVLDGEVIGWGHWARNPIFPCMWHYINESSDGGGNQTGTFVWDPTAGEWTRTASSHPAAKSMELIPAD